MNKAGLAGAGLGGIALVLAIVNIARMSGALNRLDELAGRKGDPAASHEPKGPALTEDERAAEIEYLKKETKRISDEIAKAKIAIASGTGAPDVPLDPDKETPMVLTPAGVAKVLDAILEKRFKDQKAREAEIRISMIERARDGELLSLQTKLNLDVATRSKVESVLKDQTDGYAAVMRVLPEPPPAERQAQLDKVTEDANQKMKQVLTDVQYKMYEQGNNWHGFSQKTDNKRHTTPPPPRNK